jgi:multidrug efflux pump subunit AcrB
VENIERHLRMGKTPFKAALEAADEIGLAVIATSLTLVAVFVPTVFMAGIPGKFFREFGWTAAVAVLVSLLVARLLTPMMAAYLLTPHVEQRQETKLEIWYIGLVRKALHHRRITVLAGGGQGSHFAQHRVATGQFVGRHDAGCGGRKTSREARAGSA